MDENQTEIVKFGELKPGDKIIGSDGQPVTVTAAYQKHLPKSMFEITMDDGEVVQASGNHMWYSETNIDVKNQDEYKTLAKKFFNIHEIPEKLEEDELFPIQDIIQVFGDEIDTILFIEKAARSLGYSSYTPHFIYTDKIKVADDKEAILNYSYNDFVEFLHNMKSSLDGQAYFYFGEVRTTEQIFALLEKGAEINIPHKSDIF